MGGKVPSPAKVFIDENKKISSIDEIVEYILPIYYVKSPLRPHEKEKIKSSWNIIVTNRAQEFYRLKKDDPEHTPCHNPMEFFANRFYRRLIEVHPTCQVMFNKSTFKQGQLLMNMISLIVSALDTKDQVKFEGIIKSLAEGHNRIGVRSVDCKKAKLFFLSDYCSHPNCLFPTDSIFGEVLFWTLRLTLGTEIYDTVTNTGWVKLYSSLLRIIIPIAVKYEKGHKDALELSRTKRLKPILQLTDDHILPGDHGNEENRVRTASDETEK